MIAAGLDVVSEAKPTATTHTTPVASRMKPRPLRISAPSGVEQVRGKHEGSQQHHRVGRDDHSPAQRQRGGNPRRKQRQARAARDDQVAEDTSRGVARAGLDTDQDRDERTEEHAAEQRQQFLEVVKTTGRTVVGRIGGVLDRASR